jgi:predicted HTH transcriptional regulator
MFRVDDTPMHKAMREALCNTICNADYSRGNSIVIYKYLDKVIFKNSGTFFMAIEKAKKFGTSNPGNKTIHSMFTLINIGERAGSGIPNIITASKEANFNEPLITQDVQPDEVIVTVYTTNEVIGSKNEAINEAINLSNNAKKVLVLIKQDPSITKPSLAANLNVSKATIERALDELKQANIVLGKTSNKNGTWIIKE